MNEAAYRGTHVRLDLLEFPAGSAYAVEAPESEEAVLVLLEGSVTFNGDIAYRKSVFDTRATAVYLPPRSHVMVETSSDAELALATTVDCALPATSEHPTLVEPDQIVVHERGKPGWQRAVHDVVADNVPGAERLIVGETFNEPGQWSSFPPHKHDGADGEPALEEVYYYRFDRSDGFGFQGLYEADGTERAEFLRHGSVVGIPRGYHPVCAAPGYRLYYLWALVGAERQLAMYEDPAAPLVTGLIVWIDDRLVALGTDAASDVRLALATVPTPVEYFTDVPALGDGRYERLARACATLGYPTVDDFNARAHAALAALAAPAALVVVPVGEPLSAMAGLHGVEPAAIGDVDDDDGSEGSWVIAPWAIDHHSPIVSVRLFVDAERARGRRYASDHRASHCVWGNTNGRLARVDDATVIVERDGKLLTPALAAGALDDIWRSRLLADDIVREAALATGELGNHGAAIVSPRGKITLLDGADASAFEGCYRALEQR